MEVFFVKNASVIFAIEPKRHMASVSIFGIIIGKFYYKKKFYLVILFEIDKSSKVGFYPIILPFDLTINLLIEGNRESLLNVKKIA